MGRPERPVDQQDSPVAAFALDLRALRQAKSLTYRQMAERAHFSVPTLSSAAAGRELPTWPVLSAYLSACDVHGAELDAWHHRWTSLTSRTRGNPGQAVEATASDRRTLDPDHVRTPKELAVALNTLRGSLSYQQLAAAARGLPQAGPRRRRLPVSTISDLLTRGRTSRETLTTYLTVCQVPETAWDSWLSAWARSRPARPGRPPAAAEQVVDFDNSEDHTDHDRPHNVATVAAVDDHPIVLHGLAGILGSFPDLDVVATATSLDELLSGPGRKADVVVLGLDLADGTDVTTNIHRLLETGSAVVVFSALARPENVRAAMRAGACGYVPKSDDVWGLATAIRAAATGGGWVSPQLAFVLLTDDAPDRPSLSAKEREALQLYAAGMPMKAVARRMNVGIETAKQYIERVRLKYRKAGREAATKVDLYRRAVEDGYLEAE